MAPPVKVDRDGIYTILGVQSVEGTPKGSWGEIRDLVTCLKGWSKMGEGRWC